MRRGLKMNVRFIWVLVWALAWALAGPGCARFRNPVNPAPSPKEKSGKTITAGKGKGDLMLDPSKALALPRKVIDARHKEKGGGAVAAGGENCGGPTNGNGHLMLNPSKVLALQMQAIREQDGKDEPGIRRRNRFTQWLDQTHQTWFCRMDNAVRRVDTMWLTEGTRPYDYELSTFKLRTLARVGGRSNDGDSDFKVRFRADVALPGLERKLHLFLDNAGRDSLPGADPMKQEDDTRLGVSAMLKAEKHSELDLGGGVRWRSSVPVAYGDLEWRWKWDLAGGELRLTPRGYYYTDDGLGQTTTLTWTHPAGKRKWFQTRTAERSTEKTDGLEFEQSLRFAWLRSGKGRGWVAQASVFPHLKSSEWFWDDALLNLSWRDALYRKWIYYTITPQVQFPREDDYHGRASLRIGLEILFGGKIGELQ